MQHVTRLTSGLQDLLCEGRFVDVRICCSDHSPSDGLGAHRAMLAAASPGLLGPSLQGEEGEEEMVCLQLPDYTSSCVASVLSILYYGETWLHSGDQVSTINSLLSSLGVQLEVWSEGCRMFLRQTTPIQAPPPPTPPAPAPAAAPPVRKQKIKAEPQEAQETICPARIKKERLEERERLGVGSFPLVESSSLFKCPNGDCPFCAFTVPEIEAHMSQCSVEVRPSQETASEVLTVAVDVSVDVKPQLKRELISSIKQEATDPLERKADLKKETGEGGEEETEDSVSVSDVITVSSDSSDPKFDDSGPVGCEEPSCNYVTRSMSSYKAHRMMHQRKDILRNVKKTCPVCKLGFKTLIKLKEHLASHGARLGVDKIRCEVEDCHQNINTNNFYDHVIFGHFADQYKLKCDQCNFTTTTSSKLKNHLMMHLDERPFKCRDCEKTFRTNSQLTEHSSILHSKEQTISCDECLATFNTQSQLNKHKQIKHSNVIVSCHLCEKTFSSSQGLKAHIRNVHNKSQSKLICSMCGHLPGECRCEERRPGQERVPCPVCGKQVISKNLPSHLHYHRQSTLRPYICQECSQTFTHASSLKRHALLHSGKKQFQCEQCGKEFFQKVAYETHCKSHTRERLHCKGCNQPFLTKYLLNFHLKSKTVCREVY